MYMFIYMQFNNKLHLSCPHASPIFIRSKYIFRRRRNTRSPTTVRFEACNPYRRKQGSGILCTFWYTILFTIYISGTIRSRPGRKELIQSNEIDRHVE